MLVKRLSLRNIRSYNDGEETLLDLPEGVVLFEGDIGSGKSTLLYALEFALFGLSDMKGTHLLSEGRKEGSVSITFEAGGTEYTVDRRLKVKGGDVVQDECHISAGGEKVRLSPSDLKERVVSILGFNEPTHPKAESLVYRYAVFTPQEQMKEILVQSPDERLHVIRRVLGAQSYQVAAENSDIVERRIREIAHGLKKASEDLDEKQAEKESESRVIAHLESEIPRLQEKEATTTRRVRDLESKWKELLDQREALGKAQARIPLLKQDIADLRTEMAENDESLRDLESQLANVIEPIIKGFEAIPRPSASARTIESKLNKEREKLTRLIGSKESLEEELAKTRDLLAKGVCPLCGQRISGDFHSKTEHIGGEVKKLEERISESTASVESLENQVQAARAFEDAEKEHARATRDATRAEAEIKVLRRKLRQSNSRLSLRSTELEEASSEMKALEEVTNEITDLESRLGQARSEEREASLDLNQARTELADATKELARLEVEVKKKQESRDEAGRLTSYQSWLGSFFRPTVELIEKQTLTQAAARFNEHFQRFFTSLVDDPDMVVKVKEDFSPLFEREGFEQDFEALSGGERTSMALAYRFALNSVVKESVSTQPELLILDEPTDGFSKEQVYKMRGLLEELDSRQVILVSHEKELESMADHIFNVEKRNGTSFVSRSRAE
jgi:DNA repair protein SbcC/Rad50